MLTKKTSPPSPARATCRSPRHRADRGARSDSLRLALTMLPGLRLRHLRAHNGAVREPFVANYIFHRTAFARAENHASSQLYFAHLHNSDGRKTRIQASSWFRLCSRLYFPRTVLCENNKVILMRKVR
jgi:hypothetical protein